ncbi:MAG: hypothetical protein J1F67_06635 [Muribaculaceae bacterium]|nr:hypothetical protein [Muribaculaceae bacterium]
MKRSVINTIDEAKKKLGGYIALYSYNLMNLAIKADPVSLLGINIVTPDGDFDIENIADIFKSDDYHFAIIPKDKNNLLPLGRGIMESHPEFLQEVKNIKELMNEEAESDEDELYIELGMPEVNEDRYNVLKDGVKTYSDIVDLKVKGVYDFYKVKIEGLVVTSSDEDKDEAKASLDSLNEMAQKTIEEFKSKKMTEIEEAYQRYLEQQSEIQIQNAKEEKAHGKSAGLSMKLYGDDDE